MSDETTAMDDDFLRKKWSDDREKTSKRGCPWGIYGMSRGNGSVVLVERTLNIMRLNHFCL